jgi:hypothetical protein
MQLFADRNHQSAHPVTKTPPIFLAAAAAAALMSLPAAPAKADETGFYVGANVGRVLSTYRRSELDKAINDVFGGSGSSFVLGPSSVEKDHAMWSADVGYMLSRNVGIVASYLYLGSLRYSVFGTQPALSANVDYKSHGPALALLGSLPMSNLWELDARVGAYQAKTIGTYHSEVNGEPTSGRLTETSTSLLVGVGTAVTVTSYCAVRLDYLRLENLKEKVFNQSFNVDLVTVGITYVF